jgi:hypothetical protein
MIREDQSVIVRRYTYQEQYEHDARRMVRLGYRVAEVFVDPRLVRRRALYFQAPKDNCIVTYRRLH